LAGSPLSISRSEVNLVLLLAALEDADQDADEEEHGRLLGLGFLTGVLLLSGVLLPR
jgi:hypothetical protein